MPDPVDLDLQLDSRRAANVLRELPHHEARYLALLSAGYSYRDIQELDGVTYQPLYRPGPRPSTPDARAGANLARPHPVERR